MNSRLALKLAASICVGVIGLGLVLAGSPRDTRVARNTAAYQLPKLTYELPLGPAPEEPIPPLGRAVTFYTSSGSTTVVFVASDAFPPRHPVVRHESAPVQFPWRPSRDLTLLETRVSPPIVE